MNHIFEKQPLEAHQPLMSSRPLGLSGVGFNSRLDYMKDVMRSLAEAPDCKSVEFHGPEDHGGHGSHGNHLQMTFVMGDKKTSRPVSFRTSLGTYIEECAKREGLE